MDPIRRRIRGQLDDPADERARETSAHVPRQAAVAEPLLSNDDGQNLAALLEVGAFDLLELIALAERLHVRRPVEVFVNHAVIVGELEELDVNVLVMSIERRQERREPIEPHRLRAGFELLNSACWISRSVAHTSP